jgi:hypothetical protein
MANEDKKNQIPHPNDPVTPRDYDPTHDKEFPHEETDISGDEHAHDAEKQRYEDDVTDEMGRPVSMRRPGEFILPDDENVTGEGWTLPTRPGGGWDQALEHSLEEQIDEPESPDKTNQR